MGTIVKPKTIRLCLSDVAKRALADLQATKKATPAQLADAESRLAAALDDGYTIDVKRRLNTGEQQDLFAVMAPTLTAGERAHLQTNAVMTAKVLAYLLAWNLTDEGEPIPMSPFMSAEERLSAVRSLDPDVFNDIREAIDWHERQVEQEIAEAKKIRGGVSGSNNSSSSPDGAIGLTTTSVN